MDFVEIYRKIFRIYPKIRSIFLIRYNRFKFWINGAKFGKNMRIYDHIFLSMCRGARLSIGDNFTFSSGGGINPLSRNIEGCFFLYNNAQIIIGNKTGISSASLRAKEKIIIGNYVNIGSDCIIIDTDAHSLNWKVRAGIAKSETGEITNDSQAAKSAPIIIEDYVLIGTRCIILKGVTIGARSVIAAGSVVTKSIPADCIAGGNPCKVIRYVNE